MVNIGGGSNEDAAAFSENYGESQNGDGGGKADEKVTRVPYSIPGVLHYIQHEWAKFEMERAQWEVERAELQVNNP